jgi:ketosteroid isomerase-like protein
VPEDQITDADIERLKHGFDLYNAQEWDALRELVSPDIVIERVGELPPLRGWEEMRAQQEPDAFEWQRMYPLDWVINGNRALVRVRLQAKGAGSGLELDTTGWQVWTVRDGVAVRMQNFLEEADARAAAGLDA